MVCAWGLLLLVHLFSPIQYQAYQLFYQHHFVLCVVGWGIRVRGMNGATDHLEAGLARIVKQLPSLQLPMATECQEILQYCL